MAKLIPPELKDYLLPYNWDVKKVWALPAETTTQPIRDFEELLALPFWSSRPNEGMLFDVTPNHVLANLGAYPHQRERMERADVSYPVDFIFDSGRYFILDGLHRIARLKREGQKRASVRRHRIDVRNKIEV